jgi:hypothetical protein
MRLRPCIHRIERKSRRQRKGLLPLPIRVAKSITGITRIHHVLSPVIFDQRVQSVEHGKIKIVPNQLLPSIKFLTLQVSNLLNRSSSLAHLHT